MAPSTSPALASLHETSLAVCDSVYGGSARTLTSVGTINKYYEADASQCHVTFQVKQLPNSPFDAVYENPFITASSRSVIADMFKLSQLFNQVDAPRPLAALYALLRLKSPDLMQVLLTRGVPAASSRSLFRALRIWSEVGDVCENESFDYHRKTIIEHTLNILFFPGLHVDRASDASSSDGLLSMHPPHHPELPSHPNSPALPVFGTSLTVPSPFYLQLHIITRLSFNEQGLITHHRDFWDVKDLMGLIPGVSIAQWVGTRLTATGLTYAARLLAGWEEEEADCAVASAAQPESPGEHGGNLDAGGTSMTSALGLEVAESQAGGDLYR